MNDLKFAIRQLLKRPGFSTVAVLTLALGIGASTAVFSLINAIILRPLPFPDPERLVLVWTTVPDSRTARTAYGSFADWKEQCTAFEDLAIYDGFSCILTGGDESEKINGMRISPSFFSILGRSPVLGRTFTEQDANQRARVILISHGFWQRRFGGDPNILERAVEVDGMSAEIIGVMPERIGYPFEQCELWQLQSREEPAPRGAGPWFVLGRIQNRLDLGQAQAELESVVARLAEAYPATNRDLGARLGSLSEEIMGPNVRSALWILFGAVAFVLLIGCGNLANLLLVRGIARQRELATRVALGASPLRVTRQLMLECLPPGMLGGLAGIGLAISLIQGVKTTVGTRIPRLSDVGMDPVVVAFALGLTALTTVVFAIIPGLGILRLNVNDSLKNGARGTGGLKEKSLRHTLLIGQVALAFTLLIGSGLLLRSFQSARAMNPGFNPERLLCVSMRFPRSKSLEEAVLFYGEVARRLEALPGIERTGLIEDVFGGGNTGGRVSIEGGTTRGPESELGQVRRDAISPSWFQAAGAPLLRGREFDEGDRAGGIPVAIINETMARVLWPGEDPLGKRFKLGAPDAQLPWLTVVGLARDMRRERLEKAPIAQVFRPLAQLPSLHVEVLVRTAVDPATLVPSVRQEIRTMNKGMAVYGISTMEERLGSALFERKFQTLLLGSFSCAALLLAAIGIYGAVRFAIQQRTREIGVRMILGAQQLQVLSGVICDGMKPVLIGVGLGFVLSLPLTRLGQRLLFNVSTTDSLTYALVTLLLGAMALFACWLPARHAARIDPMVALRME